MPINLPNGNEVSEIVLPDGNNASEVVGPDGNTVWTAGGDIPDSAIHQWEFYEGSGGVAADGIGDADGDINGASWVDDDDYVRGHALEGDGSDDHVDIPASAVDSLTEDLDSWTIVFTVETTDSGSTLFGVEDDGDSYPSLYGGTNGFEEASNDQLEVSFQDEDDNAKFSYSDRDITTGEKIRAAVRYDSGNDALDVFLDGDDETVVDIDDSLTTGFLVSDFTSTFPFFARDRGGTERYHEGIVDNIIFYDSALSDQELSDDYDDQPWS